MATGNTTGALASFEKILLLNPNDEQAQESIRDLKTHEDAKTDELTQELTDDLTDEAQGEEDLPIAIAAAGGQTNNEVISEEDTGELSNASAPGDSTTNVEQDSDTEDLDVEQGSKLIKQVDQKAPMTPLQQQLHDIDQYIESQRFLVAIMAYNKLLKEHPDSNEIKQRRVEAIRYARLIKKDETALVKRLDAFYNKLREYNKP
ncbi:hypothetical protein MBAV_000117 [Candidatus Magnetobacterium bavaricum]|uniref:Uncharacterized protein n=1 Tax=Candidatus Magnetobacterium bavaricum TaxID=29290 RepID=A0A0F3H0E2_9BACT|nr:hypothetical protein MBAV_000117 [Candidatus Magnetobacterium bavaricum]